MFEKALKRLRDDIRESRYVVTLHADEEMFNDDLTIDDVEQAILTGRIVERQRAGIPGVWKYRVRGMSSRSDTIEVIVKFGFSGTVIITIYLA